MFPYFLGCFIGLTIFTIYYISKLIFNRKTELKNQYLIGIISNIVAIIILSISYFLNLEDLTYKGIMLLVLIILYTVQTFLPKIIHQKQTKNA